MQTLHGGPDPVPGKTGLPLGDPDEEKRQKADEHVGGDAVVFVVVERPEFEGGLEGPEGLLHLEELFLAEGRIFRGETIVAGGEDVLPVEMGLFTDLLPVDDQRAALLLSEVQSEGLVGEKGTDVLPVGPPLILQGREGLLKTGNVPCSRYLVLLGLLGIGDEDEASAALAVADGDLLHPEVVPDDLVSSFPGEHLFMNDLVIPELLTEDIVTARGLEDAPVLLGVHAPVGYPHAAGELPAGKILLHRLDSLHVLRVPGKDPGADRDALFGNGKADDHLWE